MAKILHSTGIKNVNKRQLPSGKISPQVLNEESAHYDEQTINDDKKPQNSEEVDSLKNQIDQLEKDKEQLLAENASLNQKLKEIEETFDELKSEAYQEGQANAENVISESLLTERQSLVNLIETIETAQFDFLSNLEEVLIETVFAAVVKVMADVKINDSYLVSHVKTAIEQISSKETVHVHLSSSDLTRLERYLNTEKEGAKGLATNNIEFIADKSLDIGGCFITTESLGGLDARLESQLKELRGSLTKTYIQNNEVSS